MKCACERANVASGPPVFVLVGLLWRCILVSDPCLRFTSSQVGSRSMWTDGLGVRELLCRSQGASAFGTALPVVLYVYETCLLPQGNDTGWGCSIAGCWGRCLGLSGRKLQNTGENCIVRSFEICTSGKLLFRWTNNESMKWAGHAECMGNEKYHSGFWCGNMKERDNLWDLGVDDTIVLKLILNKQVNRAWTGYIWLMIGPSLDSCEHGHEPYRSVGCEQLPD